MSRKYEDHSVGGRATAKTREIKARTRMMDHVNMRTWGLFVSGLIIAILGLILFLRDSSNNNFLYLMTLGAFMMVGSPKPRVKELFN